MITGTCTMLTTRQGMHVCTIHAGKATFGATGAAVTPVEHANCFDFAWLGNGDDNFFVGPAGATMEKILLKKLHFAVYDSFWLVLAIGNCLLRRNTARRRESNSVLTRGSHEVAPSTIARVHVCVCVCVCVV